MAEGIPARLTVQAGRRFGCTVGGAFVVLGALSWWRAHPAAAMVLTTFGGMLVLAGLAIPTHLGPVERAWMKLAHAISRVTTPILMGAIYFIVVTPVGVVRRTFGSDPLKHSATTVGFWKDRSQSPASSMERQF